MKIKSVETFTARIYIAGDIGTAKAALRQEVMRNPLCVTIEPTSFIYTGGEEAGFVVGLVNYPRFPSDPDSIHERAGQIADLLVEACAQHSALIVTPYTTEWRTLRPEETD